MKRTSLLIVAISLLLPLFTASAQMGGRGPSGPDFSGPMAKLFGENKAFTSDVEVQANSPAQGDMVMPGQISYLEGKSRFEMNLADMKGANLPPQALEQMKQMGMDRLTTISDPDKKLVYIVYPTLKAYAEMPIRNADKSESDFEIEITELGKETVDGHECEKNKVVATDKEGKSTEFTVWNATDLKNFPVKIKASQQGTEFTMLFTNVKFDKPKQDLFTPPTSMTKYDSMMALMQQEMMKRMQNMQPPDR